MCAFFNETRNALHKKIDIEPPELRDKMLPLSPPLTSKPGVKATSNSAVQPKTAVRARVFQYCCRSAATGCACLIKNYAIMRRSSHYGGCARTNSTFVRSAHCERRSRRPRACALRRIRRSRVRSLSWKASLKKSRSSCIFFLCRLFLHKICILRCA